MTTDPGSDYGDVVRNHLTRVEQQNAVAIDDVAELVLASVRADGTVLTAGAGHSLAAVAETFYRAGGLACVRPIYHPELLPMHGAVSSTAAERRTGLAAEVLREAGLAPHDVLFVFSTSGVNPYPVELAAHAADAGCPVVAVTSLAASAAAPRRAGTTLAENATVVLDNLVPPGDATYPADAPVTAAVSTLATTFLWNLLMVRLLDKAAEAGVALPLWRSANVEGGDVANAALLRKYQTRIPQLG
ncbi:SIS domain-containing protein [Saccharothrix coeruleofusca]|uniref:SIS domain-containing protein n=1 Tax=Saccharothrix coeruleofusca TaxID=33919 RepID=A0A918AXF1_9PSEU|nr:SIS domain-containing protein [Saccharothrix coeruleofusca]MBP2337723.1 putative phosphosugar-binding protein [Saccharothrix coeruleofusca]GGP84681.1 SIS domain-containing protein [Saccharothrix coeruleofusca]